MPKYQNGYIWRKGRNWYGRWCEDAIENGKVVRKQRAQKLAEYGDSYRTESDVRPLLDNILRPLNEGRSSPQSTLTVAQYTDLYFIPHAEAECKPSTANGYKAQWKMYLKPRLQTIAMRDFRCVDATNLLASVHREHGIGRATLRHCKALLSSIFTFAKRQGVLDGVNPVQDAGIPRSAAVSKATYAATPEDVMSMLENLNGIARTAIALVYFCGLRPGEARAARWEDYDGKKLYVRQSMWRTHVTAPKTLESASAVPVYQTLADILDSERKETGYILCGPTGKPTNLNNLAKRTVIPGLERCAVCRQLKSEHGKADHGYERAKSIPNWHGWYALRRGIATLATTVDSPLAAKGLLRHSNLATT